MALSNKDLDPNSVVRIEVTGSSASQVRANLLSLIGADTEVQTIHTAAVHIANLVETKDEQQNDPHAYAAECDELQGKLAEANAKVGTLEKSVAKLNTQLKDAEAGAEKSHKAFLEEQKRADAAEARVKDLESALAELEVAAKGAVPDVDTATNDAEADAALDKPETVGAVDAAEKVQTAADDGKVKPGARTNRTTRNVSKPAEETAEQKALRETITNDLLDLGGLAEKNAQVATDVEEVLAKYSVSNGADLTTEQLEDAAADIAELIGVYFRE